MLKSFKAMGQSDGRGRAVAGGTRKPNGNLSVISDDSTHKAWAERSHMISIYVCWVPYSRTECSGTRFRVYPEEGIDRKSLPGEEV